MNIIAAIGYVALGFFLAPIILFLAFRRLLKIVPSMATGIAVAFGQRALASHAERGEPLDFCPLCRGVTENVSVTAPSTEHSVN